MHQRSMWTTPLHAPQLLIALLLGCTALQVCTAQAQVLRCHDPRTGQMAYTDGACPAGQSASVIAPARSAAEISQEQERAHAARERWQAEQLRTPAASNATAPAMAPTPSAADRRQQACDAAHSELQALGRSGSNASALEAAQRHMEMQCLGPDAYAALERSRANALSPGSTTVVLPHPGRPQPPRPHPSTEPVQRLNCNVFRCFDQHGNALPAPTPGQVR